MNETNNGIGIGSIILISVLTVFIFGTGALYFLGIFDNKNNSNEIKNKKELQADILEKKEVVGVNDKIEKEGELENEKNEKIIEEKNNTKVEEKEIKKENEDEGILKMLNDKSDVQIIKTDKGQTVIYYKDSMDYPSSLDSSIKKIEFYQNNKKVKTLYRNEYFLSQNQKFILGKVWKKDGSAKNDVYKINGEFVFAKIIDSETVKKLNRCFPESQGNAGYGVINNQGCLNISFYEDLDKCIGHKEKIFCK